MLFLMQWLMRKRVAEAYLENQRMNNRMTAQGYTAWDNVFSGNRYNLRLWFAGFKDAAARAAGRADPGDHDQGGPERGERHHRPRPSCSRRWPMIAFRDAGDMAVLIALAATLPRQIEMTHDVHHVRLGLERSAGAMDAAARRRRQHASADPTRISTGASSSTGWCCARAATPARSRRSTTRCGLILAQPTGRINVRGANGAGKSTLLASLKSEMKTRAYYWPTADRLAFQFAQGQDEVETDEDGEPLPPRETQAGLFVRRAAAPRPAGNRAAHRRADLSARRMGRQSRPQQPRRRRCAGRGACAPRPRRRDFAPRPGVTGEETRCTDSTAPGGRPMFSRRTLLIGAPWPRFRFAPARRAFRAAPSPSSCPTRPAGRSTRWRG